MSSLYIAAIIAFWGISTGAYSFFLISHDNAIKHTEVKKIVQMTEQKVSLIQEIKKPIIPQRVVIVPTGWRQNSSSSLIKKDIRNFSLFIEEDDDEDNDEGEDD